MNPDLPRHENNALPGTANFNGPGCAPPVCPRTRRPRWHMCWTHGSMIEIRAIRSGTVRSCARSRQGAASFRPMWAARYFFPGACRRHVNGKHQNLGGQVVPLNSECSILQDPRETTTYWLRVLRHEFLLKSGLDRRAPTCCPECKTPAQRPPGFWCFPMSLYVPALA